MDGIGAPFRGGFRGGPRGAPRGRQPNRPPRESPLKFEGDFDFESSNAKFDKENIEKELKKKLTISEYISLLNIHFSFFDGKRIAFFCDLNFRFYFIGQGHKYFRWLMCTSLEMKFLALDQASREILID